LSTKNNTDVLSLRVAAHCPSLCSFTIHQLLFRWLLVALLPRWRG